MSAVLWARGLTLIAGWKRSRHRRRMIQQGGPRKTQAIQHRHFRNRVRFAGWKMRFTPDLTVWRNLQMAWNSTSSRTNHGPVRALIVVGTTLSVLAQAQTGAVGVVAVTPVEMKWSSQGGLAAPGMEQLNLVGDPAKPGPYTLRLKFPKGFKIAPHTHPDSREVTILSGIFATGYGEKFDAANLKVLPAGSFYTEPANVPHYIEIKEDVVLQVSGMGPSGRIFVSPPDGPK